MGLEGKRLDVNAGWEGRLMPHDEVLVVRREYTLVEDVKGSLKLSRSRALDDHATFF